MTTQYYTYSPDTKRLSAAPKCVRYGGHLYGNPKAEHYVLINAYPRGNSAAPTPPEGKVAVTDGYWGLCFTAEESNVVVNMVKNGSPPAVTLETSPDGVTWTAFDANGGTTPITLAAVGDKVYFRAGSAGNAKIASDYANSRSFTISAACSASGSISSILSQDTPVFNLSTDNSFAFYGLFSGCTALTTAPSLPATTLAWCCYRQMFSGCTALTTAPALPATTLAALCYNEMFSGCTALTTAPSLPATALESHCYFQMFSGCTALTTAPSLPATTLESSCYSQMFSGCTSLTTAPSLPATTLVGGCYRQMFYGCTSLNEIEVGLITWTPSSGSNATTDWLSSVADTGTFRCSTALGTNETIERGANYCPEGWTVVNTDA